MYLGKEPSSGGFRLFNPCENRTIINAYAICDEKRSWKWKSMSEDSEGEPGTFTVLWDDTQAAETDQPRNNEMSRTDVGQSQPTTGQLGGPRISATGQ